MLTKQRLRSAKETLEQLVGLYKETLAAYPDNGYEKSANEELESINNVIDILNMIIYAKSE